MASSLLTSKTSHHARSNSFPSNPHPAIAHVDQCLRSLTASSSSSSSISEKLSSLRDLHDGVHRLLLLSVAQQELARASQDELFEGSLKLLDFCHAAMDALQQTREFACDLQAVLRRRRVSDQMGFSMELRKCLESRKLIKKAVCKSLKGKERKTGEKSPENMGVVGMIKEAETVTFQTVKSLLSFLAGAGGSKSPLKLSGRSLVSKLVGSSRVACCEEEEARRSNEVEMVDAALCEITDSGKKTIKLDYFTKVDNLRSLVRNLESNIQDLEENLENLCRNLIKIRVSLLNVFNH